MQFTRKRPPLCGLAGIAQGFVARSANSTTILLRSLRALNNSGSSHGHAVIVDTA